jgi:hypothetical protein
LEGESKNNPLREIMEGGLGTIIEHLMVQAKSKQLAEGQ